MNKVKKRKISRPLANNVAQKSTRKTGLLRHKRKSGRHSLCYSIAIGFVSLLLIASGFFALWITTIQIPDFKSLAARKVIESTKIYDRTGEVLLYDVHDNIKRNEVDMDNISRYIKNATVAIEDAEFYNHFGIRPLSFIRAVFANIMTGSLGQGGSTITQQVVKNTLLTPEKKISRKIKEWVLAVKLEQALTKDQILLLYLNEAPYGGNIYGVEEAALTFFGKHAQELNLAESAYIASLPQAPTYYSPYGNHYDALNARKNLVLQKMIEGNFISQEEYQNAAKEEVIFLPQDPYGIKAPHFVTWVREYLVERYGEKMVQEGGLKVTTTLDYDLERKTEEIIAKFGEENEVKYNAKNAGMIGIDPKTGHVLVMVGSRNYFDIENGGNFNVTLAHRQPGSAFKPFVYATAFMKGYTPDTVVFDLPTQFQTTCDNEGKPLLSEIDPRDCYMPGNYDNIFRGPVSLRNALAQSINIPAIKTLYLAGLNNSLETAKKMGIGELGSANQYGLTLVLGGGEVSLLDITSAYGVFANDGIKNPPVGILKVEDAEGNTLEAYAARDEQVIPKNVAREISDVLSDNQARTPAFGDRSPLYFEGRDVADKTGTTNDYRDAWTVGYTPSFALGAWVGNNDNSSMEKKVAGYIVTPIWNAVMLEVLAKYPDEKFKEPEYPEKNELKPVLRGIWEGSRTYFTDKISGKLATNYTPNELRSEHIIKEVHTILYWVNKTNPNGGIPEHPENDPQFNLWEKPVRDWVVKTNIIEDASSAAPIQYDDVHTPENAPKISIVSPEEHTALNNEQRVIIKVVSNGRYPLTRVDYYVDNIFIGTSSSDPFEYPFIVSGATTSIMQIKVIGYDSVLNTGTANAVFDIITP